MRNYTLEEALLIQTPLGVLRCSACATSQESLRSEEVFTLRAEPFSPDLPEGKSVAGCVAVVLRVKASAQVMDLRYRCMWLHQTPACTGPETGEALDAQGWEDESQLVLVGTDDEELLSARVSPSVVLAGSQEGEAIQYSEEGLAVGIALLPPGTELSLHFIVAWNPKPEPSGASCWYAVGTPHHILLAGPEQIKGPSSR